MLDHQSGCANPIQLLTAASPSAVAARVAKPVDAAQPSEVRSLLSTTVVDTFWIDRETFVPLKAEQNLGPEGSGQSEVTSVEFDVALPDTTFPATPPSGRQAPGSLRACGELRLCVRLLRNTVTTRSSPLNGRRASD
jgi:hypothetical protein